MAHQERVISQGKLVQGQLQGKTALITGAGGGIGFETARALVWLGAKVVIAEINKKKGEKAATEINKEFGQGSALFIKTDIGEKSSVKRLLSRTAKVFGDIDILINNATLAPIGAVHQVGVRSWDNSYRVNLRGPVLLITEILPGMLRRQKGVIVMVPSSGAAPYMGAYEVFKTSQVELANTLAAELEETDVITYSIGPGIVKTETAQNAIEQIAPLYGKSVEAFYKMSENLLLTAEEAGAGFAASVALAGQYRGLEIGSIQALMDAGINIAPKKESSNTIQLSDADLDDIKPLFTETKQIFIQQLDDWQHRPIFERQWLNRDFKKQMNAAPDYYRKILTDCEAEIDAGSVTLDTLKALPLEKITAYYRHQIELLKGYEKDKNKVNDHTAIMNGWINSVDTLIKKIH